MYLILLLIAWIGGIVWFVKSLSGEESIDEFGNVTDRKSRKHLKRMAYTYH